MTSAISVLISANTPLARVTEQAASAHFLDRFYHYDHADTVRNSIWTPISQPSQMCQRRNCVRMPMD